MIPRLLFSNLSEKNNILDKKQKHYLKNVLRLKTGDEFILFNGKGLEAIVNFIIDKNRNVSFDIKNFIKIDREAAIRITVAQALCLSSKMDFVIQKSTELGAAFIQPISTSRSLIKFNTKKVHEKIARWQRIADSASAQCGRNVQPKVLSPLDWKDFIKNTNKKNPNSYKWLLDPFSNYSISESKLDLKKDLIVSIGPEAGFSDEEEKIALENNFQPIRCGKRILRTETASVVALSIINNKLEEMT